MKTLIKLAKTNKKLPILQTILVKNGTAQSTDMDMAIFTTCNMPDGLYHAETFTTLNLPSPLPITDFPVMPEVEKFAGAIDVSVDDLAWVFEATSYEAMRFYLNGIFFTGSALVATDGHRLNKLSINGGTIPSVIVPNQAIEYALAMAKEDKQKTLAINFYAKHVTFHTRKFTLQTKLIYGTYPDYERVIPKSFQHTAKWNNDDIQACIKNVKALAKLNSVKTPVVALNSHIKAYGQSFPISNPLPIEIGFNAIYLADAMSGTLQLNDPTSPCLITNGNRQTVLMPIRL